MVLWDSPVAWTTAVLPPQPIPIASAAAHCLRILSFMRGLRSLNLRRRLSTITESGILTEEHLGSYCQVIIAQFLSRRDEPQCQRSVWRDRTALRGLQGPSRRRSSL